MTPKHLTTAGELSHTNRSRNGHQIILSTRWKQEADSDTSSRFFPRTVSRAFFNLHPNILHARTWSDNEIPKNGCRKGQYLAQPAQNFRLSTPPPRTRDSTREPSHSPVKSTSIESRVHIRVFLSEIYFGGFSRYGEGLVCVCVCSMFS